MTRAAARRRTCSRWRITRVSGRVRDGIRPGTFGGFVQSRVAQYLHPQRMVLVAPAVGRFEVEKVPKNTLVIHGEHDDVVSLSEILAWARPQELPVFVLPGAGHFFHGQLQCLHDMVIAAARGWSDASSH